VLLLLLLLLGIDGGGNTTTHAAAAAAAFRPEETQEELPVGDGDSDTERRGNIPLEENLCRPQPRAPFPLTPWRRADIDTVGHDGIFLG
jgi:hypothetical protein